MQQNILHQQETRICFAKPRLTYLLAILLSLFAVTTQAQWANVGGAGFSAGNADYITMALDGSTPYVAYRDLANGDKATVMKFNGTNWVTVGNAGFSAGVVTWTSIAIHNSTPYLLYRDWPNSGKATVMKFDGANWVTVGTPGFSTGNSGIDYATLAFSGSTPYVAFSNLSSSNKATVMKFDGTSWQTVGPSVITTSQAIYISLAFDGSTPFISFQDGANGLKATVKKFDGTNWVNVGNAGFSAGSVEHTSLAFEGSTPYVAYKDVANSSITVMKFDGSNWINVGSPGFAAGYVNYPSLVMKGSTPYVAYLEFVSGLKFEVKKFNGSSWVNVGNAGFSAGFQIGPKIVINGTELYVAYTSTADKAAVAKTTICDPISSTINQSICQGSSYMFNGIPRTTAGTYVANLTQVCGSDSLVTLNLTVIPTTITASMASSNPVQCGLNGNISLSSNGTYNTLSANNFSSAIASPYSITNNASINNGQLQLTPATNSQNGALIYTPSSTPPNGLNVSFDMDVYSNQAAGNNIADGMSFNYGVMPASPTGNFEDGILSSNNGLVIRFKTWQTQRVEVLYQGIVKGTYDVDVHQPMIQNVQLAITPAGLFSMRIGNKVICTNLNLGTTYTVDNKSSWKIAWAARTGGANNRHAIDNIEIEDNQGIEFSIDNWINKTPLPFFSASAGSYTVLGGGQSCSSNLGSANLNFNINNFTSVANVTNSNCNGRTITVSNTLTMDTLIWSDFSSRPTLSNFNDLGNATFSNGSVQLTDNTGGQNGRIVFPQTPNAGVFTATFKARVWDGNNADGFSFNYGQIDNVGGADGGMMNTNTPGLSVCFPTWNTNNIIVKYKNNVLTTVPNTGSGGNRASFFTPIEVSVNAQYQLTVKWNGTTYISNYDLVANSTYETDAKTNWQFAWGARTGGQFDRHQLDDILVTGKTGLLYSYDGGSTYETNATKTIAGTQAVTVVVKAEGTCNTSTTNFAAINNTLPVFTPIADICSGTSLAPLPTTSNNGIVGTWLPALNNLASTTYTFTPNAGQCAATATITINVKTNYTITASAGSNGNISPSGNSAVCEGDNQTYTITPDVNYQIADVLVDGVSVGVVSSYTFTNVTTAHTISASFALSCVPSSSVTSATACYSYTWTINNVTYSAPGIYIYTNGCQTDSLILTMLACKEVKVLIQGYYTGTSTMQPVLLNSGISANATECDTLTVELHDATPPYNTAFNFTGILNTNGTMSCTYPEAAIGNSYYLVLKHRNSVETWSASPELFQTNTTTYDFTTAANKAYSANQIQLTATEWGIYAGDVNQDLYIDVFDYLILDTDLIYGATGYVVTDITGDASTDLFDYLVMDGNIISGISAMRP